MGVEAGAQVARSRALAVLRIRSRALAVALLPAAVAVVLLAGGSTDHLVGGGWHLARWITSVAAVVVLLAAAVVALVVARARPAMSPTVPIAEESALDLYHLVRDLADRLGVPAPSAIALTPDCDSWLEDRTHPANAPPAPEGQDEISGVRGLRPAFQGQRRRAAATASPVLVIGSPFLWWMRVGELRAVLAPVVAGTGPSAHPDIAAARRFVRGLDAAVAVAAAQRRDPVSRAALAGVGWVARLLLRSCRVHAAEMERGVAVGRRRARTGCGLRAADRRPGAGRPGVRGLGPAADPGRAARLADGPLAVPAGRGRRRGAHGTVPPRPAGRGLHVPAGRTPGLRPPRGARRGRRGGLTAGRPPLPRGPGRARPGLGAGGLAGVPGGGRRPQVAYGRGPPPPGPGRPGRAERPPHPGTPHPRTPTPPPCPA